MSPQNTIFNSCSNRGESTSSLISLLIMMMNVLWAPWCSADYSAYLWQFACLLAVERRSSTVGRICGNGCCSGAVVKLKMCCLTTRCIYTFLVASEMCLKPPEVFCEMGLQSALKCREVLHVCNVYFRLHMCMHFYLSLHTSPHPIHTYTHIY